MPPRPPPSLFASPLPFLLPRVELHHVPKRTIKSIQKQRPSRFNKSPSIPILGASAAAALQRKSATLPLRTGAIAMKKGMTALYDLETGKRTPCTIVQLDRCQVVSHKTRQRHGYYAVQVGCGWNHPSRVKKPELGHFTANGVSPKEELIEFRVKDESGLLPIGKMIEPNWFQEGQYVDVRGVSRGMGFEGGMKRWGFHGQPASHGTSLTHRAMGSAGQSQGGGSRVLPGKKMAGNMGAEQVTVQNLKILKVFQNEGIVVISGAIPGPRKSFIRLQDALKKPWPVIPTDAASVQTTATA
ncbi:MAG: 54S ribosomal protein L9, mitochondrial [Cirrosporium novae-zelandiae]|nr:MAG: 54S ribosomal protein L9, mitochondrial [Cirrosporium novae-zelandiae]